MLVGDLMQSLAERLKFLRESKGLSLRKLAEQINVHFSTLGSYEQGRRNPDLETLKMLAEFYNVSVDYLLGLVDDPKGHLKGEVKLATDMKRIPIVGKVCAGNGIPAEEEIIDYALIDSKSSADFGLEVKGNSMFPVFKDGDWVFVKKQPIAHTGEYVVCYVNGNDGIIRKFVKKGRTIYLVPENPDYERIIIEPESNITWGIIGVVVGKYERIMHY
ncbi:LexA family protein [Kosmotoga pacifica]|uniref:LexA family protein n=1 Tax=Kosmotoga pacifica TaxID=1330330 RepID=UPI00069BB369|nr:XRE family transcriptional regulator [Kosmotoga pacifica]